MEIQIEGKILEKLPVESGTSARGEWKKQNFIIETVEQFPRKICIAAWTNSIPVLDTFQIGEMVSVSVNIESREFNGKWYTDIRAWRIDRPGQQPMQPGMPQQPMQQPMQQPYGQPMQQPYGMPQPQYPQYQQPQYPQQPQYQQPQQPGTLPYGTPAAPQQPEGPTDDLPF
jgi:hypothetical protein